MLNVVVGTTDRLRARHFSARKRDEKSGGVPSGKQIDGLVPPSSNTWSKIEPYFRLSRLDKPIGTMLLLHPCLWSLAIAAPAGSFPDMKLVALFSTGSFIMRSAGCTINDLWDKNYDAKVERTKNRPLATGEIGVPQAVSFLGLQLTAGLGVLLQLNTPCILMGFGVMPLVVAYPLMKRVTHWPQLVLGLAFNWGALMGHAAATGAVDAAALAVTGPLYAGAVAWTLVYDTLYAHQDKKDDKQLGLKSTALYFGDNTKPILHGFSLITVGGLTLSGYMADLAWPFYIGMTATAAHLNWQIGTAELENSANLWERFTSNNTLGGIVGASIVAGKLLS
ncbi:unnamed protein product [Heterosigma akashiwo]